MLSQSVVLKSKLLTNFITVYLADQFNRTESNYNFYQSNSINKYNSEREKKLNLTAINFLIDFYNQINNIDFQSDFGLEYESEELILEDVFGWLDEIYYSKTALLLDVNDKITYYYSLIDDEENYHFWLKKKINLMMEIEINTTPDLGPNSPIQCPRACEINVVKSLYEDNTDFFYFELEFLDTIGTIVESNVNTKYSNIDFANKLLSITNTIDLRLKGKDFAYGDKNFILNELNKYPFQNNILSYDFEKINKNEFKALIDLEASEILSSYAVSLITNGYIDDGIIFVDESIKLFENISFELVKKLSYEDNYVLENYMYTQSIIHFLPKFL